MLWSSWAATRNMIFRMSLHTGTAGVHTESFDGSGDTEIQTHLLRVLWDSLMKITQD